MKSHDQVTTVYLNARLNPCTLEAVRKAVGQTGGRLVTGEKDTPVDVADDGAIQAAVRASDLRLLLVQQIQLAEKPADIPLTQEGVDDYNRGRKLRSAQEMQALLRGDSAKAKAAELDRKRMAAFSRWGKENPVEAFTKMQEATKSPAAMTEFNAFRDELVKQYGM